MTFDGEWTLENSDGSLAGGAPIYVYGEDGNDIIQGAENETQHNCCIYAYLGDGDDKLYGFDNVQGPLTAVGGNGNDKLDMGRNHPAVVYAYGGEGDDIIYGPEDSSASIFLHGDKDFVVGVGATFGLRGNDRIYGGNNSGNYGDNYQ